jgi:hypothetical protein
MVQPCRHHLDAYAKGMAWRADTRRMPNGAGQSWSAAIGWNSTPARIGEMPTRWHNTSDGRFKVSTPELTAVDIVQHEEMLGGMARVRAVLRGLWLRCSQDGLVAALNAIRNVSPAQRLGALMDMDAQDTLWSVIERWLDAKPLRPVSLSGSRRSRTQHHLMHKDGLRVQ